MKGSPGISNFNTRTTAEVRRHRIAREVPHDDQCRQHHHHDNNNSKSSLDERYEVWGAISRLLFVARH